MAGVFSGLKSTILQTVPPSLTRPRLAVAMTSLWALMSASSLSEGGKVEVVKGTLKATTPFLKGCHSASFSEYSVASPVEGSWVVMYCLMGGRVETCLVVSDVEGAILSV